MIETIYTICTAMDVPAWCAYALLFMHRFVHVYACMELNILYVCRAVAIKWHVLAPARTRRIWQLQESGWMNSVLCQAVSSTRARTA
jgi:hypothetical protein